MQVRVASLLVVLALSSVMSCKKTDDPNASNGSAKTGPTPTSMVGTWKVTAFTFDPAWTKTVNGTTERYTDYVQYLKRINETCLTDVVWTFTAGGAMSTNVNTLSTCGYNGPNSQYIVDYLVEPEATYVESSNKVAIKGKVTGLDVTKTFAPGNLVSLQWPDPKNISSQDVPTTYTLTLKKQ